MRRAFAVLLIASACVILPPDPPPPVPTPVPVPVRVPVEKKTGSGVTPVVSQLWLFRVDRGTANLADAYARLVEGGQLGLIAAGIDPGTMMVGSLYEPRLLWANGVNLAPPSTLADTLRYHAAHASDATPSSCTTSALVQIGADALHVPVVYPAELDPPDAGEPEGADAAVPDGSAVPARVSLAFPLSARPDALLIFLVDTGARPQNLGVCQPESWMASEPARWLQTQGAPLPLARIRYVFLSTGEGITSAEQRQRCLASTDFPRSALDSIEASPVMFFEQLAPRLNRTKAGLALQLDLCASDAAQASALQTFIGDWMVDLQKKAP